MECTLRNQTTPQQIVGCVLRTMTQYKQPHGLFQHRNGAWNAPYPNVRRVRFTHHDTIQTTARFVPAPQWCMECTLPKLNMVRAGAVQHPSGWLHTGYNEIQSMPARYRCIDVPTLTALLGFTDTHSLRDGLREWVDLALAKGDLQRDPAWTMSIAVGRREYLDAIERELRVSHPGRVIEGEGESLFLREEPGAYMA